MKHTRKKMKRSRENSMSIFEAVEDIHKRTKKRAVKRHICARQFAKTLMDSYPDLMFWQNTPPDVEDLTAAQLTHVPESVRQVWTEPITTHGRMISSWILDVYAGSRKAVQFGNKWDALHEFNYSAKFKGGPIPPEVHDLPQPLMRDFRADRNAILALCSQAVAVLSPKKEKGEHVATPYVLEAARQVAERVKRNRTSIFNLRKDINLQLERFNSGLCSNYIDDPIVDISFHNGNKEEIKIIYLHDGNEKSKTLSKSRFSRKISDALKG